MTRRNAGVLRVARRTAPRVGLRTAACAALLCAFVATTSPASAQLDARRVLDALQLRTGGARAPNARALRPFLSTRGNVQALVRVPSAAFARQVGLVPVTPSVAAFGGSISELDALASAHPTLALEWAPPRHPLLDRARDWLALPEFRQSTGATGAGVVVGIVDTGFDADHPDFMHPDGSTRVAWTIDFARPPAGKHPDLEERFGCTSVTECAVFSAADIDEAASNSVDGDEPMDRLGHGTHVASLAAGNGAADERFQGVAPNADLIVAQVARGPFATIDDVNILLATRFVFDRAEAMGMPAVVNLSLGSDFGAHDGTSFLERGLSELVGPEHPGRAIVVAAGNSASLLAGLTSDYPEPLGIHTEVHLPDGESARVPILTPAFSGKTTEANIFVWISTLPGDALRVGFDNDRGDDVDPIEAGEAVQVTSSRLDDPDDLQVTIINGARIAVGADSVTPGSAVVVISGKWETGRPFPLWLEGPATARLWVQSDGQLGPLVSFGAVVPRATKEGTITVPASAPELIAVGATLNRTSWVDFAGRDISMPEHGALDDAPEDTIAFFSSAGPTATGVMKPDIVAPGGHVIAAMSSLADPRDGTITQFSSLGRCGDPDFECFVVDDRYAISSGTSMAAPLVAGSIALLLEEEPTLDQEQVRVRLQSGARALRGEVFEEQQLGPGALDLNLIEQARLAETETMLRGPSRQESQLRLASSFARPAADWPLQGKLLLRTGSGRVASGFAPSQVRLTADNGTVRVFRQEAPGLWHLEVVAAPGSGGQTMRLRVHFRDALLLERELPIAVDRSVSQNPVLARGGCSLATPDPSLPSLLWLTQTLALSLLIARHRVRRRT